MGVSLPVRIQSGLQERAHFQPDWKSQKFHLSPDGASFSFEFGNLCDAAYFAQERVLKLNFKASPEEYPFNPQLNKSAVDVLRYFSVTLAALEQRGLSIHAALGVRDGKGVLFSGASGKGKSTLAKDFLTVYGQADDVAIIRRAEDERGFDVGPCITRKKTWENVSMPQPAKLKAIVFLEQSVTRTTLERIDSLAAMKLIISEVIEYTKNPLVVSKIMGLLNEVILTNPCYLLKRSLTDKSADEIFDDVLMMET